MNVGLGATAFSRLSLHARSVRVTGAILGVILAAWALWTPILRDTEGDLMPLSCLVVTFAFAILIAASLSNTAFSKAAIWFALFVVGQALYLQLIDAGPRIH